MANYYGANKTLQYVAGKRIHWSGGRSKPPPDTPTCGFDGSLCPDNSKSFRQSTMYKGGSYSSRFFFYSSSSRIRDSVDGVELYRRLPLRWLGVHIQVRRSSRLIDRACLFLNQETEIGLVSSLSRLFSPPLILLISRCGYSENRRDG